MSLQICVLASGSSGNCTLVRSAETAILVDAGLSARETTRRLESVGCPLAHIRAICLSHEHSDHTAGVSVLHRRHKIPLFANSGTIAGLRLDANEQLAWNVFQTGSPFAIGGLRVEPFSVPHDASDPVGFVVGDGATRVGVVTDMGSATHLIRERLRSCRAIVLEANHDVAMLQDSERPWSLKQRILGRQGHLSNEHAADLIADIAGPGLEHIFLAHLSSECNCAELALKTAVQRLEKLGHRHVRVSLSYPNQISDVWHAA
ncbi:MAG: MBL fold metallo-hydrolase [Verrucomicrobia bacterium]|nr:MAG: MBL fold metallo-hydrolase [Verrucomicrobiota bacterium]